MTERIEINPEVMHGKPVIRGTRVPVELLLRKLAEGATISDLLDSYPRLSAVDILAALEVARQRAIATIALTGHDGGRLAPCADLSIKVPARSIRAWDFVVRAFGPRRSHSISRRTRFSRASWRLACACRSSSLASRNRR